MKDKLIICICFFAHFVATMCYSLGRECAKYDLRHM